MLFDSHVHSAASRDSQLCPQEAISTLARKGLGVIFTEHVDFVTPTVGKDMSATDAPKVDEDFLCDFDIYPSQYESLRNDSVLLGLEIGLNAAFLPLNKQVADNDYDFILGSIHFVDGDDVYRIAPTIDAKAFCIRYLTYAKEMVELSCSFIHSLAHIDYAARYSEPVDRLFYYANFPKEFDGLLQALADRELAMEINTSRLGDTKAVKQLLTIYKRFSELGGKYVTIGSDAHSAWALGKYYAQGLGLAKMANLQPVYYKKGKRIISCV